MVEKYYIMVNNSLKSLTSEATPSATQFLKGHTKLAVILDYKRPWMLCLALQPGQKSDVILPFEVVLSYQRIILTK